MKRLAVILVLVLVWGVGSARAADEVIGSVKKVSGQAFVVRDGQPKPALKRL